MLSMAEAVHKASIVCCFMTPEYEKSPNCKLELESAQNQGKRIITCLLSDRKVWKPTVGKWLHFITNSIIAIDFTGTSEASIRSKITELINKIREQHSASSASPPNNTFEPIRSKYLNENQIERIVSGSRFPIEQSYINLSIVENKEQKDKEKKLEQESHGKKEVILGTFEEIYGIKTSIDAEIMFEKCKDRIKKVLILGRAGIGKSTFCQYVTYRWAKGEIWPEYDLVVLIHLRKLTNDRYPPRNKYLPADLVEKEYFPCDDLSTEDKKYFKEQCNKDKVLWILDGYDEFAQNIPEQLKDVFDHLRNTQHHILTSRPYAISLPYDIKMEIVGFTDDNIPKYVGQFFDQISTEMTNASLESEKLLRFLRFNPSIWGIAHIPVNLDLICSLWTDPDTSKTTLLTMTRLYDNITEWLCRRYLARQDKKHETITKQAVHKLCRTELQFLEHLAFKAMENNEILLSPALLEETENEMEQSLADHPQLLNIGILKSYDIQPTGNRVETNKQHYFVHLSFQEHFAARHLVRTLQCSNNKKALDFIHNHKYNQRFALVFVFASGLLTQPKYKSAMHAFWATIQEEPLDLVGLRHIKLITECIDEIISQTVFKDSSYYLKKISKWLGICARQKAPAITKHLSQSLERATSVVNTSLIQHRLRVLLGPNDWVIKLNILKVLSNVSITEVTAELLSTISATLRDEEKHLRKYACEALGKIGRKAETIEVIAALVGATHDEDEHVRNEAYKALRKINEKAATSEVIAALLGTIRDENDNVRMYACEALGKIGEKAATNEMIAALLDATRDERVNIRLRACDALEKIGENAATSEVIGALVSAMRNEHYSVREKASGALGKIGERAATSEVIAALLGARRDEHDNVRAAACQALGEIVEKAATSEVIEALVDATRDERVDVQLKAFQALGEIGEKAATSVVIAALLGAMRDEDDIVLRYASKALGRVGEKAATSEVIEALAGALCNEHYGVRMYACEALRKIGEKATTSEVIARLVGAMRNEHDDVQEQACKALGRVGEKAATSEVVAAFLGAMGDEYDNVRDEASEALGKIGKKAATGEVIAALLAAMRDGDEIVRRHACKALGRVGEKAATSEVVAAFLGAMGDEYDNVREEASEALGKIGKKAATGEVIAALLAAMRDGDEIVRRHACKALGRVGEKAATREVIAAFLGAMGDEYDNVRDEASEALGKIGKKAATGEVIAALLAAMRDGDEIVRRHACKALGRVGEKAATSEVVAALLVVIRDEHEDVRKEACGALGKIGAKAATSEVIAALVGARHDEHDNVRAAASQALGEIGEKAATSEVIAALVGAMRDEDEIVRRCACKALNKIGEKVATRQGITSMIEASFGNADFWDYYTTPVLEKVIVSYEGMRKLRSEMIPKLASCIRNAHEINGGAMRSDRLIHIYLETGDYAWLPVIAYVALLQGIAVTAAGGMINVYDSSGLVELPVSNSTLVEALVKSFRTQKTQLEFDSDASDGNWKEKAVDTHFCLLLFGMQPFRVDMFS